MIEHECAYACLEVGKGLVAECLGTGIAFGVALTILAIIAGKKAIKWIIKQWQDRTGASPPS